MSGHDAWVKTGGYMGIMLNLLKIHATERQFIIGNLPFQLTQWVMADKCMHALELHFIVAPKLSVTTLTWLSV